MVPLRFFDGQVQNKRYARKGKKQDKRCGISAARCEKIRASCGNEGRYHQIEVANAEIGGKMLLPVKGGGECGGHGGRGAVGKTGEAKTHDAKRQGMDADRDQGHSRRYDGEDACPSHCKAATDRIEYSAGDDASKTVTDGKNAHESGGKSCLCANREGKVTRKADHRAANRS